MSRTVTLSQIKDDISSQADIVGAVGATKRHTATMMNRFVNQSILRFRSKVSAGGSPRYLTSTTGTLTAGATSPYPFSLLDLSSTSPAIVKIYGVDITIGNKIITLDGVPFTQRAMYGAQAGTPMAWAHYATDQLAILPAPQNSYAYVCWYLPVIADLVNDSDTWDGTAGWEQWIAWDVVTRILIRDQTQKAFGIAMAYKNEIMDDILKDAKEPNTTAADGIATDKFGRRLYGAGLSYQNRLPPRY